MRIRILGKIYQYYLNAYMDAYLSKVLVIYAKEKLAQDKLPERLERLVKVARVDSANVAGYAYTYYYWNGLYDFLDARLYERIFGFLFPKDLRRVKSKINEFKRELEVEDAYTELENETWLIIKPIIKLVGGEFFGYEKFLEEHNLEKYRKSEGDLAKDVMQVQRVNILSNTNQAQEIVTGTSTSIKSKYALDMISELGDSRQFKYGCIKTLRYASMWDRVFIKILRLLFRKK